MSNFCNADVTRIILVYNQFAIVFYKIIEEVKRMKSKRKFFAWILSICMMLSLASNQNVLVVHAEELEPVEAVTEDVQPVGETTAKYFNELEEKALSVTNGSLLECTEDNYVNAYVYERLYDEASDTIQEDYVEASGYLFTYDIPAKTCTTFDYDKEICVDARVYHSADAKVYSEFGDYYAFANNKICNLSNEVKTVYIFLSEAETELTLITEDESLLQTDKLNIYYWGGTLEYEEEHFKD